LLFSGLAVFQACCDRVLGFWDLAPLEISTKSAPRKPSPRPSRASLFGLGQHAGTSLAALTLVVHRGTALGTTAVFQLHDVLGAGADSSHVQTFLECRSNATNPRLFGIRNLRFERSEI
jgi:hypothetical protein